MKKYTTFNRGCVMRTSTRGMACGALQMVVKTIESKMVDTRYGAQNIVELWCYGTYAAPSGIGYAISPDAYKPGEVTYIHATAWAQVAGFVETMHLKSGDIITVYASDFHLDVYRGKTHLSCKVTKIEIDRRKGADGDDEVTYMPTTETEDESKVADPNNVAWLRKVCTEDGIEYDDALRKAGWSGGPVTTSQYKAVYRAWCDSPVSWM